MQTALIRRKLLAWFRREKRSLPWRGTRDPYRIWVSEVMLQQTTVAAVRNRYPMFLERFPNLESLARASQEAVLASWSGLGYYRRARDLHRAARAIASERAGVFPRDPQVLQTLPGFGPYLAAAVASLAFGAHAPAADANVTRVISRLFAIPGKRESRAHRDTVLAHARELLPRRRPADVTAALMDLGQTICLPRRPDCLRCPLGKSCAARREGRPERYPWRLQKAKPVAVHLAAAFVEKDGRALLVRRHASYLDGLWEFPSAEAGTPERSRRRLAGTLRSLGLRISSRAPSAHARHAVVNRRLSISIFSASPSPSASLRRPAPGCRWFRAGELDRAAVPTLTRKIARAAGFLPP